MNDTVTEASSLELDLDVILLAIFSERPSFEELQVKYEKDENRVAILGRLRYGQASLGQLEADLVKLAYENSRKYSTLRGLICDRFDHALSSGLITKGAVAASRVEIRQFFNWRLAS